jgi:hypothetical protein
MEYDEDGNYLEEPIVIAPPCDLCNRHAALGPVYTHCGCVYCYCCLNDWNQSRRIIWEQQMPIGLFAFDHDVEEFKAICPCCAETECLLTAIY